MCITIVTSYLRSICLSTYISSSTIIYERNETQLRVITLSIHRYSFSPSLFTWTARGKSVLAAAVAMTTVHIVV